MPTENKLVVVANRLPVRRVQRGRSGAWEVSPGGLVSALMPILRDAAESGMGGAWVGWPGERAGVKRPFEHEGVRNVPVAIGKAEFEGYYEGMSNSSLWPLYHDVVRPPAYRRVWWRDYEKVNRLCAEAAASVAARGAFVWVHDYHLHLAPGMLRKLRPDLRIGFFLHIPFPGRGLFAQLPWRRQLIEGTLGADVVGFQTKLGARNFIDLARWYADARAAPGGVRFGKRQIAIDAFPISIDTKRFEAMARSPDVVTRAQQFRNRLGDRKIMLGVDRLDYTKGIDVRLRAFQELLRTGVADINDCVMIQSAVPTRERVSDYQELRATVEGLVGQINGDFAEVGRVAVQYLRQNLPPEELAALYVAADVMLVTPYRDGMNLVAKEYVASRYDDSGALILSEFTGAAHELSRALLVNPHDLDAMVMAMDRALHMSESEMSQRMHFMRGVVKMHDVFDWAASFMERLTA